MVRISALGWSSDLRNLPEMNFIQLYDYPVVSREYRHIVITESCPLKSVARQKWGTHDASRA